MKKRNLAQIVFLTALVMGSTAYAGTETTEQNTAAAVETAVLGEKTETACETTLVNATGRPVTAVMLKSGQDEEFSENLLEKEDVLEAEESCILYCELQDADKKDLTYDLKIAFTETESYVIHEIPFKSLKENTVKICALDGVAYIEYTDAETGKEVNTKEAETAKRDEEAAKQETAAAGAAEAASSGSSYEETYNAEHYDYSEDYSYEDDYDYSYDYEESYEESYEEPGEDECIADGLFW